MSSSSSSSEVKDGGQQKQQQQQVESTTTNPPYEYDPSCSIMTVLGPIKGENFLLLDDGGDGGGGGGVFLMNEHLGCDTSTRKEIYMNQMQQQDYNNNNNYYYVITSSSSLSHNNKKSPPPSPPTQQQLKLLKIQEYSIHRLDHISTIKYYPFHHIENMTLSSTTDVITELQKGLSLLHLIKNKNKKEYDDNGDDKKRRRTMTMTILDVTSIDCGRDYKSAITISKNLGINVIIGTTPNTASTIVKASSTTPIPPGEEVMICSNPQIMKDIEASQIDIESMEKELLYGIDDSGDNNNNIDDSTTTTSGSIDDVINNNNNRVKAGFIGQLELSNKFHETELRQLKACAVVQSTTNAPLLVAEASPTKHALQILDYIENCGGLLNRTVLAHVDMYVIPSSSGNNNNNNNNNNEDDDNNKSNLLFIRKVLDRGVTICFDRYSFPSACFDYNQIFPSIKNVVDFVYQLLQLNPSYIHQIVFSVGICMKLQYEKYGGTGYKIWEGGLLPRLRIKGFTNKQIHTMLVENPIRLLQWWKPPKQEPKAKLYIPCDICHKQFEPILGTYYTKFTYTYCGSGCLRAHRLNGFKKLEPPP